MYLVSLPCQAMPSLQEISLCCISRCCSCVVVQRMLRDKARNLRLNSHISKDVPPQVCYHNEALAGCAAYLPEAVIPLAFACHHHSPHILQVICHAQHSLFKLCLVADF